MSTDQILQKRADAAEQFNEHEHRSDGLQIINSLTDGLNVLRESFLTRIREDVEIVFGKDSMLVPVSPVKTEAKTRAEIDIYQIVESASAAWHDNYLSTTDDWFVQWLARLRLADSADGPSVPQRLAHYLSKTPDDRRRAFAVVVERALPESRRAPLIMYRLLPLAIGVATALAFKDHVRAQEARNRQKVLLPGIGECRQCHGGLLENSERCKQCGNPFWKYNWLTAE